MSVTSIIIPTLNEENQIGETLTAVQQVRGSKQILVADGGSVDRTVPLALSCGATVVEAPRGRGQQMLAAAGHATGDVLWFLHADTRPLPEAIELMRASLRDTSVAGGNFAIRFSGNTTHARRLTAVYPWLRLLGLCYGDSGIFVRRSSYQAAGGLRPLKLFEDVDLVRRLRSEGRFVHLNCELVTSSRRFEQSNAASIWAQWITLQMLYWMGFPPDTLADWYAHVRR